MTHKQDLYIIENLIGKPCECTLACNSIKIRFGCDVRPKGTSYIWIDAPWEFQTNNKLLTASYDCPDHEADGYDEKFEQWSKILNPINHSILNEVIYTKDNELELFFEGGYYIYVPYQENESNGFDDWYEHWYAKEIS